MNTRPRIACSETALNGALVASWDVARDCGITAIEIYGSPDDLHRRLPSLRSALRRGVVFSTVCSGPPFLGRLDARDMEHAVGAFERAISVTAEIEASGIVVTVAGPPCNDLAPHVVDALARLARHAESVGTEVFVEPLNRYEDGQINRLEQAVQLCEDIGSDSLFVVADFFHMNIEEQDPAEAIRTAGSRLRHVHVADSNRRQPGAGHLDFSSLVGALRTIGFDGWLTLECVLDEPVEDALRSAARVLHEAWELNGSAAASKGSPGWRDDLPSSSSAPGTTFTSTAAS